LISFLMTFVLIPLTLLVALTEDLGAALSPAFVKDFIRRMWGPILKVELFMMFSGTLVMLLGFALCFVGAYAAQALMMMASYHLYYQLYEMYLARGGMEIPLKEELSMRPRWQEDYAAEVSPAGPAGASAQEVGIRDPEAEHH